MNIKLYKDLMNIQAISGFEKPVRDYMKHFIEQYPAYQIKMDKLGSIFAYKKSNNPNAKTVMIAGHMDEVGFMVVGITKEGFLKLKAIGGISGEVFVSQIVSIHTKKGVIKGIIGALPPHFRKQQTTSVEDLLLDIGAESQEQALHFGVELGNMVSFDNVFTKTANQNRLMSKAIDNRYGCGLALETIAYFSNITLPFHLVIGATVQEEVGLRGATTSGQMFMPDIFIALDASPVHEMDKDALGALGKGFLLRMQDPRNQMDYALLQHFVSLATKHKIPYQYFISKGGTDAAAVLDIGKGSLATTIGLPARYIHSTCAMMDKRDLKAAKKMLFTFISDLNHERIESLLFEKKY